MKKTYLSPDIETVIRIVQEPVMVAAQSGINSSLQSNWGGAAANSGQFDEDDDNHTGDNLFTIGKPDLWD